MDISRSGARRTASYDEGWPVRISGEAMYTRKSMSKSDGRSNVIERNIPSSWVIDSRTD